MDMSWLSTVFISLSVFVGQSHLHRGHGRCPTACPSGTDCVKHMGIFKCWPVGRTSRHILDPLPTFKKPPPAVAAQLYKNLIHMNTLWKQSHQLKQTVQHRIDKEQLSQKQRFVKRPDISVNPVEGGEWRGGSVIDSVHNTNEIGQNGNILHPGEVRESFPLSDVPSHSEVDSVPRDHVDSIINTESADKMEPKASNSGEGRSEFSRRIGHAIHKTLTHKIYRLPKDADQNTPEVPVPVPTVTTPAAPTAKPKDDRGSRPECQPCDHRNACSTPGEFCYHKVDCAVRVCQPLRRDTPAERAAFLALF